MRCPACAADNPPEHRFCEACGAAMEQRCEACGTPARPAARFCGQCGAPLHGTPEVDPAPPGADDAVLARDFALAGEWSAALEHAERAGDLAADAFSYTAATDHYTAALAAAVHVAPPPVAVAALHVKR
ncbi:MAG: double zinc ribbon domain-containing protein, partial [Candidatus Binatia bacterium]